MRPFRPPINMHDAGKRGDPEKPVGRPGGDEAEHPRPAGEDRAAGGGARARREGLAGAHPPLAGEGGGAEGAGAPGDQQLL